MFMKKTRNSKGFTLAELLIVVAIIAVLAKLIFATIGMILSGQDIDTAVRGGAALAPIGEFSFIIAGLGISLGVMDSYLYPVIVAASILTIMITPVMIRQSDRIVEMITGVIPPVLRSTHPSGRSSSGTTFSRRRYTEAPCW